MFGGHYTGWHNSRRHREDNFHRLSSTPEMADLEERYPRLLLPTADGDTEEAATEKLPAVACL